VRRNAMGRFLDNLFAGDPVALGMVGALAVIGLALGLFVLKIQRDHRLEDEARARKHGRKP
jgi:hypothetical protein